MIDFILLVRFGISRGISNLRYAINKDVQNRLRYWWLRCPCNMEDILLMPKVLEHWSIDISEHLEHL